MTSVLGVLAIVALGGLAAWVLGSVALRVLGVVVLLAGAFDFFAGADVAVGLFALVLGLVLWLAGHWLYAFRHHAYAGPLVERIFLQVLPRRLDPTRGWGVPVVDASSRRDAPPIERGGARRAHGPDRPRPG